ncbi:hypothetical protein D3871_13980 [Noviherbaspirillum saxi]|uniref:Uncharacterized protein n=2 Tax=Noviherbaspirillum saxi TaxID=2320863 RepID=A0A3A3FWX5_9BURK|nr:hypothetical protein D3871_13980 [Noviherbaspirillum saxi]
MKKGWALLAAMLLSMQVLARPLQALDDGELAGVSGGDGVSFAAHIALNDPTLSGAVTDSRLSTGFQVDGKTTYIVIRNLRGTIDVSPMNLSVQKKPDGSDYLALTLPETLRYGNWGYESLSAQADPLAPVTESLGRVNVNGALHFQGQMRFWAH